MECIIQKDGEKMTVGEKDRDLSTMSQLKEGEQLLEKEVPILPLLVYSSVVEKLERESELCIELRYSLKLSQD